MTTDKPAWLKTLQEDGYVVIPDVIPKADCETFQSAALDWLEKFHGFNRNDKSTWDAEHLPFGPTGGLYTRYAVNHESFVWAIRTQPGILDIFSKIWGTDDIVASFDGMNVTLPLGEHGRTDIEPTPAWPHIDQNPRRLEFELYQGIANLAPNGPKDGGLCVLKGSHKLHGEHFASIGGFRPECDAGPDQNSYKYHNLDDFAWYKKRCEEVKVCAPEGGLILWDSRTVHWNASPTGEQIRFATYVCYAPRKYLSEEGLAKKREVFDQRLGTTHWPHMNVIPVHRTDVPSKAYRPDGSRDPLDRDRPFDDVVESESVMRLVGVRA